MFPIYNIDNQFICQQFQGFVLVEELELNDSKTSTNNSYIPVHKINSHVISGNTPFLRNKLNLVVDEENKKLLNI